MSSKNNDRFLATLWVFSFLAAAAMLAGCQGTPTGRPSASGLSLLYVVLEGPWAIAPDPDNVNGVLAIAPSLHDHDPLYVKASSGFVVFAGEYTLSIANTPSPGQDQYTPLTATIPLQALKAAQGNNSFKRYAIHLPKPDLRSESSNGESRVDTNGGWPVTAGTKTGYTVEVSLQYSVADFQGITFSGASDPITIGGVSTSLPRKESLSIGVPRVIRIGSEPSSDDTDSCSTHSKGAFRELMALFNLKDTIDFPAYDQGCQVCGPQGPNPQPTCPSASVVQELNSVQAFVKETAPSKERENALKSIEEIRALILGKSSKQEGQKQLIAKIADVEAYIQSLKPSAPKLEGYDKALTTVGELLRPFNLPGKDCKGPVVGLSVGN